MRTLFSKIAAQIVNSFLVSMGHQWWLSLQCDFFQGEQKKSVKEKIWHNKLYNMCCKYSYSDIHYTVMQLQCIAIHKRFTVKNYIKQSKPCIEVLPVLVTELLHSVTATYKWYIPSSFMYISICLSLAVLQHCFRPPLHKCYPESPLLGCLAIVFEVNN